MSGVTEGPPTKPTPAKTATMTAPAGAEDDAAPAELVGRWRSDGLLKRDLFSTVERGRFLAPDGTELPATLRRIDGVPWWTWLIARHLFRREAKALAATAGLGTTPPLLHRGRRTLVRGWVDGLPMQLARPVGDAAVFASAARALRGLHRRKISHNDLAKQQNWLVTADGEARLIDFQLAQVFRRRGKLFRIAGYEDLRHMLKHKRTYAPATLTPTERRILARKSVISRFWLATGKRVYVLVTRGIFGFRDREGAGPRLVYDAPRIVAALQPMPGLVEALVLPYPDRRSGTGLYLFVEARDGTADAVRRRILADGGGVKPPELIQVVDALPRGADHAVRTEILQLVATNQVDLIPPLIRGDVERRRVDAILAGRANLRDRFSF